MDKKICSECGTENENDYIYCKNCGALLTAAPKPETVPESTAQETVPKTEHSSFRPAPAPEAAAPAFKPVPPVYNTENGNTGYTQSGAPAPDGIPQEEIALFIGKKSVVIKPKFIKMEITNSKTSWCWPAALLFYSAKYF